MPDVPKLMTRQEVADLLKVSRRKIYRLTMTGVLPVVKLGKVARYDPRDVAQLVNSCKIGGHQG